MNLSSGGVGVPQHLDPPFDAIDVNVNGVVEKLKRTAGPRSRKANKEWFEQAERVAWRHMVLWVDAALCSIETGLQTVSEAFFAHVIIKNNKGKSMPAYRAFLSDGGVQQLTAGKVE